MIGSVFSCQHLSHLRQNILGRTKSLACAFDDDHLSLIFALCTLEAMRNSTAQTLNQVKENYPANPAER
jgi:hypothetical protein